MSSTTPKILIYSHDSFGLGHLRRCRAIAQSLVGDFSTLSVLILSGSPIIGSFEFRSRVDFVRIPGVIKLRNGEYTPLSLHINIDQTLAIRSSIIEHTAEVFDPDIFIVDKEPTGLRGEVLGTLEALKKTDTRLVLGLRDVMDDPETLTEEWDRKNVYPALEDLYDEIWVYGPEGICDPLDGIDVSPKITDKLRYTGYLRRSLPKSAEDQPAPAPFEEEPYILVTPGGGGDGVEMVDWVMRAYEARQRPLFPALIVLGPFMPAAAAADFTERAEHLRDVEVLRFTPQIEPYLANATAIVGMGGYNTFCEILSFDKPTLMVPRVVPRREQAIRAERAEQSNLLKVLPIERYPDVDLMAEALSELPQMAPPSTAGVDNLLGGLDVIGQRVGDIFAERQETLAPKLVNF
ncbi:glycosyltransferase family protein [Roseibium alexandrii]|uniref:Putative glycosyl transferase n=1 Tax=Roseibium alexandrii (strain DSM 17067 / NCIMB 14079 / DFL-11) TaxID=244592 RepID=A0A5E8GWV9_ROSAD|nr:glycosyltransferase [Roseibium alexandrii]EEE44494.1 putative glycosyl transferase [Roseibium alexandrii DFL-11]